MFLGHKCVFIKHLTYIFKNSFWKTDLFALYIETCFLACLCLSSFAPRDVRGELFSDSEIAKLRDRERKPSTENYYRLRGRAAKCSHRWHGWRRRLPCLVGSSPTGDAIFSRLQDCEVARSREKYFFAPVAERGTPGVRQLAVCRTPLIMDKSLPGAPFFEDSKIARLRSCEMEILNS